MRITKMSWLIVLVGAVAFGGGIAGLARLLPSDATSHDQPNVQRAAAGAQPSAAAADPTAASALGLPPESRPAPDLNAPALTLRAEGMTPDELAVVAASNDIVIDDLRWRPDGTALDASQVAAMKAANPHLRVLRYLGALTNSDGPIFNVAPDDGVHGPWFLRDGSGEFVRAYQGIAPRNALPSYAFDPSSIDVRNDIGAWARQFARLGYDGVLLDGVSGCVPVSSSICTAGPLLSDPVNKTTNRRYTAAEWLAATTGLLRAICSAAPQTQIFIRAGDEQVPLYDDIDGTLLVSP